MAGLLTPLQSPDQSPAPAPAEGQPSDFTDQEIKAVNLMIKQGVKVLLDEATVTGIAEQAAKGDPAQAIADAVAPVIKQIHGMASGGGKLDIKVPLLAARELVKILVAVISASGVIPMESAGQVAEQAFKLGIEKHNQSAAQAQAPQGGPPAMPPAPQQGEVMQ